METNHYFKLLIKNFPNLQEAIEQEEPDHICFRMEIFAGYTIEQIKSNHLAEVQRCFDFQESQIDFMNSSLENALAVSYCEVMLLGSIRNQIKPILNLMPPKLKIAYLNYQKYYSELVKAPES